MPLVLRDPETGGEVVYVNGYERVIAVRTDGTPVWDVPTGLGAATAADQSPIGLAWVPNADAIVGLTRDGFVFLLDRRTGAPLLPRPCSCPASARRRARRRSRRRWRRPWTRCSNRWSRFRRARACST